MLPLSLYDRNPSGLVTTPSSGSALVREYADFAEDVRQRWGARAQT
jgi:hypothetical protein